MPSGSPTHTADDLLSEPLAVERGFTRRALLDWTERGLLGAPRRCGSLLDGGRGSRPAVWTEAQRQLFLLLLARRDDSRRIADLCNVPVALWLYGGPDYVPVRQVRRALRTYGEIYRVPHGSKRRAGVTAKAMMRLFAPDEMPAKRRREVQKELTTLGGMVAKSPVLWTTARRTELQAKILPIVEKVIDPDNSGRNVSGVTPEIWTNVVVDRLVAIDRLDTESPTAIDDSVLEMARIERGSGKIIRLSLVRGDSSASIPRDLTWDHLVNEACSDALTTIGLLVRLMDGMTPTQKPQTRKSNRA
jgi:hypothetical protein